jgi:hypothetical protein
MHSKSKKLQARATSRAPSIKIGRQLHRLAMKAKSRKIHAVNGNYLDSRKANLLPVSMADVRILNRATPITKLVGVERHSPPSWLKTECIHHARIRIGQKVLRLGSFKSLEEAGCAYDRAARMLHGHTAQNNQSLGFISAEVARTAVCRKAARVAKGRVRQYQQKIALQRLKRFDAAKTPAAQLKAFKAFVSPKVMVALYAKTNAHSRGNAPRP